MPLDATSPIKPVAAAPTPSRRNGGRQRDQQDLNHLLGFTLPPRAPPPPTHLPRRSNRRNPNYVAFDRSRFVHQFRFIVRPDRDYTAHFADPDIHLAWSDILQVILPTSASALSSVTTAKLDQGTDGASQGGGIPACPICLSEPTAARMTKCGHVFCYPCVLHYLALADHGAKSRNCPVCHDSIQAKDLKSVKWFDPTSHSGLPPPPPFVPLLPDDMDDDLARALELSKLDAQPHASTSAPQSFTTSSRAEKLKMRLIRRPQMTTLALPRSATWPSDAVPPLRAPWQFTPDAFTYAKFLLGAPDYMRDELLAQKAELEREILTLRRFGRRGGTDEELGIVFVDAALRKVHEQLAKAEALKTTSVMTARKRSLREIQQVQELKGNADEASKLLSVTDTSSSEVETDAPAPPPVPAPVPVYDPVPLDFLQSRGTTPLSTAAPAFVPSSLPSLRPAIVSPPVPLSPPRSRPHQRRNVLAPPPPEEDPAYYFYQAATGQPIFLQPLDIRILKSHFGTYQSMPNEIEVIVEGADEGSMNDELRRRCKWLSHLPIASDVVFVEADLGALVPRKALEPYSTALKQRRQKRRNKARKEDRAKAESELKAAESLTVFESTYAFGARPAFGPPSSSSWDDVSASFPAPPLASSPPRPDGRPPAPGNTASSSSSSHSSWSRPSFASALHASTRSSPSYASHAHDEDLDDRWGEFEERLGRERASTPRTSSCGNLNVSEGGGQAKGGAGGGGGGGGGEGATRGRRR
ncbi:zinc finger, RING-type protein [Rhodotorula toruloides]|uniref:Zinc finger, RING-type protein n=1 Tax=Rhodotorula toruloides TaxID=5286 RepID=A0A511KQH2_RHOTO|nr:zinc finger, RING-type protein [Rhodotorula toruloides]